MITETVSLELRVSQKISGPRMTTETRPPLANVFVFAHTSQGAGGGNRLERALQSGAQLSRIQLRKNAFLRQKQHAVDAPANL